MQLRPFIGTAVLCAVVAFLAAQVHTGFMLIFVAPFLLMWLLYSVYVVLKHPSRRRTQAIRAALWLLAVSGILLTHWHYHGAARKVADVAASSVIRYKTIHGHFPESLEAAGINDDRKKWRIVYLLIGGRPSLFYPATFVAFDTYGYDFEHRSWVYYPD